MNWNYFIFFAVISLLFWAAGGRMGRLERQKGYGLCNHRLRPAGVLRVHRSDVDLARTTTLAHDGRNPFVV